MQIGSIIEGKFNESGISLAEFSRRLNTSRRNCYNIFQRNSIDTDLLVRIGTVLKYDFFQHFTDTPVPDRVFPQKKKGLMITIELDPDTLSDELKSRLFDSINKQLNQL